MAEEVPGLDPATSPYDPSERTPIFEAVASAWFQSDQPDSSADAYGARKKAEEIEYEPNLARRAAVTGLVFLCHSRGDKEQVRNLYRKLRADNFNCWFDEEDLLGGQDWDYEITSAIRKSRLFLACLLVHLPRRRDSTEGNQESARRCGRAA